MEERAELVLKTSGRPDHAHNGQCLHYCICPPGGLGESCNVEIGFSQDGDSAPIKPGLSDMLMSSITGWKSASRAHGI